MSKIVLINICTFDYQYCVLTASLSCYPLVMADDLLGLRLLSHIPAQFLIFPLMLNINKQLSLL